MDMWTMRLRRTESDRGQRCALPTAALFDHMPTAFTNCLNARNDNKSLGNIPP